MRVIGSARPGSLEIPSQPNGLLLQLQSGKRLRRHPADTDALTGVVLLQARRILNVGAARSLCAALPAAHKQHSSDQESLREKAIDPYMQFK